MRAKKVLSSTCLLLSAMLIFLLVLRLPSLTLITLLHQCLAVKSYTFTAENDPETTINM